MVDLKIPQAGESITEVQIGEWQKAVGDFVKRDETVVEIETDKASMELPSPAAGRIAEILKEAGSPASVGDVIARIDETASGDEDGAEKAAESKQTAGESESRNNRQAPAAATKDQTAATSKKQTAAKDGDGRKRGEGKTAADDTKIMPAARRLLAKHELSAADVEATGPGGRLLKEDVERHLDARQETAEDEGAASERPPAPERPARSGPADDGREEEVVPMTLLRRRIAERLVEAQNNAALLTTFNEVDMSGILALRKQNQEAYQKRYNIKLGFMSFFVKGVIDALKMFPQLNAEVRGTNIVYRNYFDIGVAVSTDRGLLVPVLRGADRMSFGEIELAINDFAQRARDKRVAPEELQGGTFTISNGGVFGSLLSTPIVNPPQSGVLGLHAIQERPVAVDGQVVIRPMMYIALTYDHRIVDGREAVTFLKRVKQCAEDPARMLIEI